MATAKDLAARVELIRQYLDAFRQANPKLKVPELRYENGWFYLKSGLFENKHRKANLEVMRDKLLERAAAKAGPPASPENPKIHCGTRQDDTHEK